jgi:tRNA-binding EMAP/Myf-like protein
MTEGIVDFSDWQKIDLRVGRIVNVEDIENADKLYKLTVDLGKEIGEGKSKISPHSSSEKNPNERTVCAGIKQHYSKEDLAGKKIILFVNLAPRKLKGIESQGMVLAAVSSDESQVILISPEEDIEVGSKVR